MVKTEEKKNQSVKISQSKNKIINNDWNARYELFMNIMILFILFFYIL